MRSSSPVLSSVPRRAVPLPLRVLVPTLLLPLLAACAHSSWSGAANAGRSGASSSAAHTFAAAGSAAVSLVSCSGDSCSVTLGGGGSRAHVLGTRIDLAKVDGGRATLRVEDRDITCTSGQEVPVGALRLHCTAVTEGTVTFSVVRG